MNLRKLFAVLALNLVFAANVFAGATPEQTKAMVNKALAHVKKVGPAKAYQDFNTPGTEFFDGELYVYAYDMNGVNLAHGGNPKMVGKDLIEMKSVDGKMVIRELRDIAKNKGEGWYEFKWMNPETKKVADKTAYVVKIPGQDAFLGSGYYK